MFQLPKDIRKIEPNYESIKELCKCMDIWEQLWNYNIPSVKYYIGKDLTSDEELEILCKKFGYHDIFQLNILTHPFAMVKDIYVVHNFYGDLKIESGKKFIENFAEWVEQYPNNRADTMSEIIDEQAWITEAFSDIVDNALHNHHTVVEWIDVYYHKDKHEMHLQMYDENGNELHTIYIPNVSKKGAIKTIENFQKGMPSSDLYYS